jgi:type I restriction enzyme, S subunit
MYAINSLGVRSEIAAFQSGSTRKRISRGNLATVGIPIAPLREQHCIVAKIEELFSELDKAVESLTLARAQLKTYRQALLKAAFEGKLTADWRAANPDTSSSPPKPSSPASAEREARYGQALDNWQTALSEWRASGIDKRKPARPVAPSALSEVDGDALQNLPPLPTGWTYVRLENLGDLARRKSRHRPRNDPRLFDGPYPFRPCGNAWRIHVQHGG